MVESIESASSELKVFIAKLKTAPELIQFNEVIATIDAHYDYSPTRFTNGSVVNESASNEGSCKIFAFAQLNNLDELKTLFLFGDYYREEVLRNPHAKNNANIRAFIQTGWDGIEFAEPALKLK